MSENPDLQEILKSAKQKGLISHTNASPFGLKNHSGPNEAEEPINQTLSGIITVLIIVLLVVVSIFALNYFLTN